MSSVFFMVLEPTLCCGVSLCSWSIGAYISAGIPIDQIVVKILMRFSFADSYILESLNGVNCVDKPSLD